MSECHSLFFQFRRGILQLFTIYSSCHAVSLCVILCHYGILYTISQFFNPSCHTALDPYTLLKCLSSHPAIYYVILHDQGSCYVDIHIISFTSPGHPAALLVIPPIILSYLNSSCPPKFILSSCNRSVIIVSLCNSSGYGANLLVILPFITSPWNLP